MSRHVELLGYAASLLVLGAFCMRDMVGLRLLALASNAAFIGYAALASIHPVLLLHLALLPMNAWRLWQGWRGSVVEDRSERAASPCRPPRRCTSPARRRGPAA